MYISECCGAPFPEPGYPDTDLCGQCKEHTGGVDVDEDDPFDESKEFNWMEYKKEIVMKRVKQYGDYMSAIVEMDAVISSLTAEIEGIRSLHEDE